VILVLDTNVFVSAIMSQQGASRAMLRRCLQGTDEPLMGQALFSEYESVLERTDLFAKAPITKQERETLWHAYLSVCRWVRVYYLWRPNLPDEADNHLVELAIAGGAEYLLTHNVRDFATPEIRFPHLKIRTPNQFLREVGKRCQP
jgi:putative PIN family toxin of toxin-antitoxin system